jgi:TIR domain
VSAAPDLFLSYNGADAEAVADVRRLLEAGSITTFLDRDKLVAGLPWPQALEEGLRRVRGVGVFIGRELGGWQKREMWFALDRQVHEEKQGRAFPVIPVLLPGADLTPGFLFTNTWIDLRGGLDAVLTAEALGAFERAINSTKPAQAPDRLIAICPYRGLQVFREEDAAFFFGRKAFARQLLDYTLGKDLVAVVGPSGSGKSSVVQAELLPLLRRERPPAHTWDAVSFTPGNEPFRRLASALIPLLESNLSEIDRLAEAQKLGKVLAAGEAKLEAVISRVIEKSNGTGRLLLVADQFEELFTLTPEPDRRPLARALLRALGSAPFTLLVTLRADFYSQIIALDRELSDRLASAQVNIGALTQDELRESITAPARLVGLEFEPGLVERVLADVGSEPGRLPLLEFALTELWQHREESRLTNRAYDQIGGATGALAQRAEAEFKQLTAEEQAAARRLLGRLVRVARPEEAGEDTRQRADLSEADALGKGVANRLATARLLVTGGETAEGTLSVEVAHEALIRNWGRLRVWLNEDREFLLWRQRLQVQVDAWQGHGRDAGYLFRGQPLSEAERWLLGRPHDLTDPEQQFISKGIALREREREEEKQRQLAEIENVKRLAEAAGADSRGREAPSQGAAAIVAGVRGAVPHSCRSGVICPQAAIDCTVSGPGCSSRAGLGPGPAHGVGVGPAQLAHRKDGGSRPRCGRRIRATAGQTRGAHGHGLAGGVLARRPAHRHRQQ